jgi:predicted site-specific integrase-resolvase
MKLVTWAKQNGVSYRTAWNWFKAGKLPVRATQTETGMILVELPATATESKTAWVYARVSSPSKKDDLERQATRCVDFCAASGWVVVGVVKEVASGMNDNRPKLHKLLAGKPARIVVEHKDRLTRFGFGYFERLLPMVGCDLVVMNRDAEEKADLVKDLVAVVTSFCCRLYGMRRGLNKAKELKAITCDAL